MLHEERRAGAAEAYRECARQLSRVLASHPGGVVVPVEALPDPEKLRRIADFIDKVWPYESDPKAPGDLRRWADRIEAAVSRLRPPGRPGTGLTVTLTEEERRILGRRVD